MTQESHSPSIIDARWQVFLRVVEVGSLSKAATALVMPQSMVSRAIAHLEHQCGERLLERTGRGVTLTEFGARLLPQVAQLASDAEALSEDIRCFTELVDRYAAEGYGLYRTNIAFMERAAAAYGPAQQDVNHRLKKALDPLGILAPGKSGIFA